MSKQPTRPTEQERNKETKVAINKKRRFSLTVGNAGSSDRFFSPGAANFPTTAVVNLEPTASSYGKDEVNDDFVSICFLSTYLKNLFKIRLKFAKK